MAKMIKEKAEVLHPVTREKGAWVRIIKTWVDENKPGDRIFRGMAYRVEGGKIIRDKQGNDITALIS